MNDYASENARFIDEKERHRRVVEELIEKVGSFAHELEAEAAPSEELGQLTERAISLVFSSGAAKAYLPAELGGLGLYPGEALPLLRRIAYIDGSIGWVSTIFVSSGLLASYLPAEATDEILAKDANFALAAVSNGQGTAELTEEGWKISGQYRYASGIKHAHFVFVPAIKIMDGQPVPPPAGFGFFLVPTSGLELADGWDVLGLKATGSVDFKIKDCILPRSYECQILDRPKVGGNSVSGGLTLLIPIMHLGFALGVIDRLLDEMKPIANKKPPVPGAPSLGERDTFRIEYAKKYVEAQASSVLVQQVMGDIDDSLRQGQPLSNRQHSMLRAANIHAHEVARGLANWAFARAGGVALRSSPLQRVIRDTLAGCQHFIANDQHYANVGHELLGAPDNYTWIGLHEFGPPPGSDGPD